MKYSDKYFCTIILFCVKSDVAARERRIPFKW